MAAPSSVAPTGLVSFPGPTKMDDMFFSGFSGTGLNPAFLQDAGMPPSASGNEEVNEVPTETVKEVWGHEIVLNALHDGLQMHYERGMFIFLAWARNDVRRGSYTGFSIQVLNYYLERAFRAQTQENRNATDDPLLKRAKVAQDKRWESFPTTTKGLASVVNLFGPWQNTSSSKLVRQKQTSVIREGPLDDLPNVFGDVNPGDMLYLAFVEVENPSRRLVDPLGRDLGEPTLGSFLACVPHVPTGCNRPIFCTDYRNPRKGDLCFYRETAIAQKSFGKDADGRIKWEGQESESESYTTVVARLFQMGDPMLVGRVITRRGKTPSQEEIDDAIRTNEGWLHLKRQDMVVTVNIVSNPHHYVF